MCLMTKLVVFLLAFSAGALAQTPYLNPDLSAERRAADLVGRMTLEEKVLQMQNTAPAIPRLNIPAYDWWNEALHGVARAGQATVFPQAIGLAATWDTALMRRVADVISTEARAKYHEAIRNNEHGRYQGLTFWSPNINIFRDPRWGRGMETYGEDPWLTGRMAVAFIQGLQGTDPRYFKVIATAKHYAVHSGPEPSRHVFDVHPNESDLLNTYLPAFKAAIVEGKADSVMCAYNRVDGVPACANTDLLEKRLRGDWGFTGYVVSDCGAIADIFRFHKYKPNAAEASAVAVKAGTDLTCGTEYRALVDAVKSGFITEAEINRSLERLFVARFKLGMFDPPERVPYASIPIAVNDSPEHRRVALEAARKSIVLLKNDRETLPLKESMRKIAVIGPSADDAEALLGNYNGFSRKHVAPLEGIERQFAGKAEIRYALGANYTSVSPSLLPTAALEPPSGSGHGVLAEYFESPELQGAPKLSRVEPRPFAQPDVVDPALGKGRYAIRWTGTLRPALSGDYTFAPRAPGRGAIHLFVDEKELPAAEKIKLEAGHAYELRLEYRPVGPIGTVALAWTPPADALLAEAVQTVRDADVAIAFVGLNPNLEGEEMRVTIPGFQGGDRTDLNLPETQERLLEAAIATGKPVVVVLTAGSAVAAKFAAQRAAAVLALWYGGEEAGAAIAETLAGANNPAGRLPVTFYQGVEQLPSFDEYSMKGRTYRYFAGDPLWGFGFGMSYSKFMYTGLHVQGARVTVRVKNISAREGDEVVQVYVSGQGEAVRTLRAFQRIHLRAGESRTVEFTVTDLPKRKGRISVGGGQPVGSVPHVDAVL
jgi:beta-glucosidase